LPAYHLPPPSRGHGRQLVRASQPVVDPGRPRRLQQQKPPHLNLQPAPLASILQLDAADHGAPLPPHQQAPPHHYPKETSTSSPKETIASMWRELHGAGDWAALLDPFHPWLRREVVKYGEFAQATYDAFDAEAASRYRGSCRFCRGRLFSQLGLLHSGYEVTGYLYAMSHVEMPRWLQRSLHAEAWSRDSNWMGYVAVSDDEETRRIGRRDIVVAWRGTVMPAEWFQDVQQRLEPLHDGDGSGGEGHHHHQSDIAKVEHGFYSIYTSKAESTRYNKTSASQQVMEEIRRLVETYGSQGEVVSLTVTGHSLGGALALLNAHEAAAAALPGLSHVSVVSFGAPRVGNAAFARELDGLNVKVLRVVNQQDPVPRLPGALFLNYEDLGGGHLIPAVEGMLQKWVYAHAGVQLVVDVRDSPHLKQSAVDLPGFHGLETYLHLVDGMWRRAEGFRRGARRDVALVNKTCGLLREELGIPERWCQAANKGLVRNAYGRWVVPEREPEDVPSPPCVEAQQSAPGLSSSS
ncbi:hypothetical protein Taro_004634, partial [Colocasia esculenta]|nr:hypothetical protein [Colocasia esculenta]